MHSAISCCIGEREVDFLGFRITNHGIQPHPDFIKSIQGFPRPQTITDVRSWFGLINQVSYAFAAAEFMLPFRNLLKPGQTFQWNEHLDQVFKDTKSVIIEEIRRGIEIFDKKRPTCLATDWSKEGIGYTLTQKHCECQTLTPVYVAVVGGD